MKLLHIDSSISGQASASRQLTRQVVESLRKAHPALTVTYRDFDAEPLPHLDSRVLSGAAPDATTDEATGREFARNATTLDEFLAADIVVIGAPMYNFSVSSQLKAWIDRIMVAGKTFTYGADGPRGLVGRKRVIIASSRGGIYAPNSPQAALDFQENYLQAVFGFIGIDKVEFVRAEGIAFGPDQRQAALRNAIESFKAVQTTDSAVAQAA